MILNRQYLKKHYGWEADLPSPPYITNVLNLGALPKKAFSDFQLTITKSRRRTVQRGPLNNILDILKLKKKSN